MSGEFFRGSLTKDNLRENEKKALERWEILSEKLRAAAKNHLLFLWIQDGAKIERIKFVIRAGANVNAVDKYGKTPLYYAVLSGHAEIQQLLIDAGAHITPEVKYATEGKKHVDRALKAYRGGQYKSSCKYFVEAFRAFPKIAYFGEHNEYLDACIKSFELDPNYTSSLLKTIDLGKKYNFEKVIEWMVKLKFDPTSPLLKESEEKQKRSPLLPWVYRQESFR